jgi:transketolase
MEVRQAYVGKLMELMEKNEKIVVLDADLASAGGTKAVYKRFPTRAFDVGVAESNMTSVAVGLSAYGFVPFIHSFAPFVSRRNFDQVAVGISYSCQNVKIVGFDPGITTTYNGGTHMCFEDVAMMRTLPNVTIVDVVDYVQIAALLPAIADTYGAFYIRMPRKQTAQFFDEGYAPTLGKADVLKSGKDVAIVTSGTSAFDVKEAVEMLAAEGIDAEFVLLNTIKPLDEEAIIGSAKKTRCVLTVENHSVHGGLYGAVTELLSAKLPTLCDAIAIFDKTSQVGNLKELKADYGLTAKDIADKVKALVKKKV